MNTRLTKTTLLCAALATTMGITTAHADSLSLIPTVGADLSNEGRAITSDGQYIVGISGSSAHGFLYATARVSTYTTRANSTGPSCNSAANGKYYSTATS